MIGSVFDYVADHGGTAVFEELSEGIGLKDYLVSRGIDDKVKQDIANAYDKTVDFVRHMVSFLLLQEIWMGD